MIKNSKDCFASLGAINIYYAYFDRNANVIGGIFLGKFFRFLLKQLIITILS